MALGIDESISIKTQNTTGYYHTDGLGFIVRITDINGNVVNSYDYDDHGNIISQTENITNDYTYTGKERDKDSGLYYYGARYYDPEIGRWLTKDIIPEINRYLYVLNNPIYFVDIFGLADIPTPGLPDPADDWKDIIWMCFQIINIGEK